MQTRSATKVLQKVLQKSKKNIKKEILETSQQKQLPPKRSKVDELNENIPNPEQVSSKRIKLNNCESEDDGENIPQTITREFTRQTNFYKIDYKFLKTVKDDEELELLRFELHCSRENLRRYKNFKTVTLNCTLRFTREKCPFGLFAVRKSFGILVYEHGNHNHELGEIDIRNTRALNALQLKDTKPPELFKNPAANVKDWHYLCTVNDVAELDKIRIQNKCQNFIGYQLDSNRKSIMLKCKMARYKLIRCQFKIMAKRVKDEENFHVFSQGEHICPQHYSVDKIQKRLIRALKFGQHNRVHKWMKRTGAERIKNIVNELDASTVRLMIVLANREMLSGRKDKKKNYFFNN
uniref:FLYWCH-type domain-containing protein n=2 Tax=Meloidogyne incognita TaxID=6306 RepID=A0A914NCV2_MELIC